jgi:hypothetical protein
MDERWPASADGDEEQAVVRVSGGRGRGRAGLGSLLGEMAVRERGFGGEGEGRTLNSERQELIHDFSSPYR